MFPDSRRLDNGPRPSVTASAPTLLGATRLPQVPTRDGGKTGWFQIYISGGLVVYNGLYMYIYIYVYIHSYIFVGGFKHFFLNLGSGNLGCMKPVKVSSFKVMHYVVVSHMFWCSTLKIGEDEAVLMSKGFNWEPLGFEWLERIKMHVWSSWLFMLVVHACLCLFLIDEYHVSCTGEMFHISYRCSSWPFREMCSFPREMSESWVIRWNSVDLRGSYCWWFRNPANQWRLVVPLFTGFYDTSQVAVWDFWTVWEFPH